MKYYQEITLMGDPEISVGFLWQKVYQQVHFALVNSKVDERYTSIGVSFPLYQTGTLGNKLRIFAENKVDLEHLTIERFLSRLTDYTHIRSISQVPKNAKAVSFIRKSVKGENRIQQEMFNKIQLLNSRDANWFLKIGKSLEECISDLLLTKPKANSKLPFILMESQETKKRELTSMSKFPLFIERIDAEKHQDGLFNCYGLAVKSITGNIATVPDF